MSSLHTETINGIVAGTRFSEPLRASKPDWEGERKGARFGRHLLLDVESEGTGWAVVFRSADKVLAGASESAARDAADKRYHRAPFYYSDQTGKPRRFVLWSTDDANGQREAEAITAAVLRFWHDADAPLLTRWAAVPPAAQPIVVGLLAIFGPPGPTGRTGSFRRRPKPPRTPTTPINQATKAAADKRAAGVLRDRLADTPPPDDEPDVRAELDAILVELGL